MPFLTQSGFCGFSGGSCPLDFGKCVQFPFKLRSELPEATGHSWQVLGSAQFSGSFEEVKYSMALRRVETELNVLEVESFWAFHKLCILCNVRVLYAVVTDDKNVCVYVCVRAYVHACTWRDH